MPRKVQPRWGDTGVARVSDFKLNGDQVAALAGALEIDVPAITKLKPKLEWIGARYRLWMQQDEKGPSQAEQNATLKKLLAAPQELEGVVAQLDYATQDQLLEMLWRHLLANDRKLMLLDQAARDDPDLVVGCAKRVLADGQKRRGPPARKTLPIIVRWLALIYEESTGLKFTHTPYQSTEYKGTPQSDGGRFVATFLSMVDPDLPETAIATEMARFVEARQGGGRKPPGAVQTI